MNIATYSERAMETFGDYDALTYVSLSGPDERFMSGQLYAKSVAFASALQELGVKPGDRVVVMIPNTPEITALYGAIARVGGVSLPILFLLADSEIQHIFADARPTVAVTTPEFLDKVRVAAGADCKVVSIGGVGGGQEGHDVLDFDELIAGRPSTFQMVDRDESDPALLIYTGGTTGRPKGVTLTHGNLSATAQGAAQRSMENGITHDDVGLSGLPLAHSFGVRVWLGGTITGGRSVLLRWFEPGTWLRCVEEYRCTVSAMVPTMMTYLLSHPDADTRDTSSLRYVGSGAAPLPLEVGKAFEAKFGCRVLEGWGLSESSGYGCENTMAEQRWGSIGKPAPFSEITVRNPDTDEEMPQGELGELCMRGPHVMPGYWGMPEGSEEALRGGWLRTGDVGYVDPDGFFFIVDRVKDLIIRGGFNIYPRDVEEALHGHPSVMEAAVIGVPDQAMGEEVKAFVVLKPGVSATEEELLAHCQGMLAKYKTPRSIAFLDALPKSGVGKILRRELRDLSARAT